MAKYKNIGSAIHNWAHSFLSIENFNEQGEYFIGILCESALSNKQAQIEIDVLEEKIAPSNMSSSKVNVFLNRCRESFNRQLQSQNIEPGMVSSAVLKLSYNFTAPTPEVTGISFRDPWKAPKAVRYSASICAKDDRGKTHQAKVEEWWL